MNVWDYNGVKAFHIKATSSQEPRFLQQKVKNVCLEELGHPETVQSHTNTGTDQIFGESCAEGVQHVRALRSSIKQVIDGDGTARCHHAQHWGSWISMKEMMEVIFLFSWHSRQMVKPEVNNQQKWNTPMSWESLHYPLFCSWYQCSTIFGIFYTFSKIIQVF